jgi:hypothetical protein
MEAVLYHEDCLSRLARRGKLVVKDKETKTSNALVPKMEEFKMAAAGVKILKICKVTTKIFEQEKVPTMPHVVERMYTVDKELEAFCEEEEEGMEETDDMARQFAISLREKLSEERRFPEFGMNREMSRFGNFLNPALQGLHLRFYNKLESTKIELEAKLKIWNKDITDMEAEDKEEDEDGPPVAKMTATELLRRAMKEKAAGQTSDGPEEEERAAAATTISAFQTECKEYEAMQPASPDVDQLNWWRIREELFPLLSFLVRVVFGVPVASSKSERVYSAAGRCVTAQRNRLAPEMVQNLVVMCTNLPLLKEKGLRK